MRASARLVKAGFYLAGIAVLISLTTCEPLITESNYHYDIKNKSRKALRITYKSNNEKYASNKILKPSSITNIESFYTDKKVQSLDQQFLTKFFDSFRITTKDGSAITKDYTKRDNWNLEQHQLEKDLVRDKVDRYYIFTVRSRHL
jgi:hypothetical protein